jgi:hypothetical protein
LCDGIKLTFWPVGKSKVINKAIQDIGMGKYNWQLFVLCGFGWFADKYVVLSRSDLGRKENG